MRTEPRYRLCPTCDRSVNLESDERFCVQDGTKMLESCPRCDAPIRVEGAKFCGACGSKYETVASNTPNQPGIARDSSTAQPEPTMLTEPTALTATAPNPNASWTATRRGRAAAILAILTMVGVIVMTWFNQPTLLGQSFVGQITGTPFFVGLTVREGEVLAYVCDGNQVGVWFRGAVATDGSFKLDATTGAQLTMRIRSDSAFGRFKLNQSNQFPVMLAPATGTAGLYRAARRDATSNVVAGWVLLPDSTQRGVVSIDTKPFPAPSFDPSKTMVELAGLGQVQVLLADPLMN